MLIHSLKSPACFRVIPTNRATLPQDHNTKCALCLCPIIKDASWVSLLTCFSSAGSVQRSTKMEEKQVRRLLPSFHLPWLAQGWWMLATLEWNGLLHNRSGWKYIWLSNYSWFLDCLNSFGCVTIMWWLNIDCLLYIHLRVSKTCRFQKEMYLIMCLRGGRVTSRLPHSKLDHRIKKALF